MTEALLRWFDAHRRALPWRDPAVRVDPYRVWVSEVMLQQTRVDVVVAYFARWLRRFPDLASLARASEQEVLRQWEGLGYYRRARNLHAAARTVLASHAGELPRSPEALQRLPGVGRYTARALAALAFGRPLVAVDGNVRRVAARLHGLARAPTDRVAEALLEPLVRGPRAAEVGEALIELGALVCAARSPDCPACPLRPVCMAATTGRPEALPEPNPRRRPPEERRVALVAADGHVVWLSRRPGHGLLGGMWGFPQVPAAPAGALLLGEVRHTYSHFSLRLTPALVSPEALRRATPSTGALEPVERGRLPSLPLSVVDRRVLAALAEHEAHQRGAVSSEP
jgi:A/G-specific adenine glycosylase